METLPTTGSDYADFLLCEATGQRCGRWKDVASERQEALRLLGVLDDKKQLELNRERRDVRKRNTNRS